ncbi:MULTISPECIES: CorA family divalent cation transporter [Sphingobacterium]|uniref:CorA family divalent cation transporter n=1 Tax=Sphingobacterium TaxID=28453 RepID=UPI0016270C2A|nr:MULTISPECIES: CorA family divalent cation transporter [Sphingobacterium]MBV2225227.1 magnesium transporter CorA [Sphingobacterium mizutaii]
MVRHILRKEENGYDWYEILDPTLEDFIELKAKYDLNDASIKDCLEIGHLPKIEEFDNYHFLILRSIADSFPENSDTLADITLRISVFYDEDFIITVHRNEIPLLNELIELDKTNKKLKSSKSLVNSLVSQSLKTFENLVINDLAEKLDDYEEIVFLHRKRKPFLMKLYYLKRQVDLIKIILTLYKDIVDYFHMPEYQNIYTQDLRDIYSRTNTLYRNIAENTAQLLSVYFNIESNHTNEIMRILTIISVFFMPLTFIVGVYGMNFKYMPELEWLLGYPAVWILMILVSLMIYIWFKRKRWL